jgi:hypothetical protein
LVVLFYIAYHYDCNDGFYTTILLAGVAFCSYLFCNGNEHHVKNNSANKKAFQNWKAFLFIRMPRPRIS